MKVIGARTQSLWGQDKKALFYTDRLTKAEAAKLLLSHGDEIIELLYAKDGLEWESMLREEAKGV